MSNGAGPYLMVEGVCKTEQGRVLADVTTGYGDWYVTLPATQWIPIRYLLMGTMEKVDGSLPYGWMVSPEPEGEWYPPTSGGSRHTCNEDYGLILPMPLQRDPYPSFMKWHFSKEYADI